MTKILRASAHRRMPWKNGRGETVEIAVFPENADIDTFDWRVSMATVPEDGAFSIFPDIDRTLSILDGDGMMLEVEGHAAAVLTQGSAPHFFPADAPAFARLLQGRITDLNVMTRRDRFSHAVTRVESPASISSGDTLTLVLCHSGQMHLSAADDGETLSAFDCAFLPPGKTVKLTGAAAGFVIRLTDIARLRS